MGLLSRRLVAIAAASIAISYFAGCKSKDTSPKMVLSDVQEARIGLSEKELTQDPRYTKNLSSTNICRLLFEGLTRCDQKGNILPGMAENIQVSPDMKTYTFKLRDAKWSNGDPVTAQDFEYSWKTQLDPQQKSQNSYMLFPIKGAMDAAQNKIGLDAVGIQAPDDKTLIVTLENPTPYFLQLAATHSYFPVNRNQQDASSANGPFQVNNWASGEAVELVKNENYWDKANVPLNKILFSIKDDLDLTTLFENGQLDWIGSPVSQMARDAYDTLKSQGTFTVSPAAGTQFLRVNVEKAPFTNAKMRKAFCLAIDSQGIIDAVMQGGQNVATNFIPPTIAPNEKQYFVPHDVQLARQLFEEGLNEAGMSKQTMAPIKLTYISSEKQDRLGQALAQNWKEAFDVDVALDPCEPNQFYKKLFSGNYDLSSGSWFADYFDPMSFLSVFQYKENGTNATGWSNPEYTRLIEQSCFEIDPQKRMDLLLQAQDILMNEMPVLPVFHFSFTFAKNPLLQAELSPLGAMQLNQAYVIQEPAKAV
jgi:oligopeptide transport system substrate-binding protein